MPWAWAFSFYLASYRRKVSPSAIGPLCAINVGFWVNLVFRAAKYVFFDPSKEMAYIPLDERGKAAVDNLVARLGKNLGTGITVFLASALGDGFITSIRGTSALCTGAVFIVWFLAIRALSVHFDRQSNAPMAY